MMLCPFASADDDAAEYFFAIDDDEPLPQYVIADKNCFLSLLKILTPTHLMVSKSLRPSPDRNSDIQNLSNPHKADV